jgi:hypothetical protein
MGVSMGKYNFTAIISLLLMIATGCTAGGAGNTPCQRACGNRPIGGGNLKGVAYSPSADYKCASGASIGQQSVYFLIYEDNPKSGGKDGVEVNIPERIPKAGISFTPIVPANVTLDSTSSDWCTDSCGIAEIKFTPTCGSYGSGVIAALVPGMTTDTIPKTTYSMAKPE